MGMSDTTLYLFLKAGVFFLSFTGLLVERKYALEWVMPKHLTHILDYLYHEVMRFK